MTEQEKNIVKTILKLAKAAPSRKKDYLLGWAEGAASMVDQITQAQNAAQQPPAGA